MQAAGKGAWRSKRFASNAAASAFVLNYHPNGKKVFCASRSLCFNRGCIDINVSVDGGCPALTSQLFETFYKKKDCVRVNPKD